MRLLSMVKQALSAWSLSGPGCTGHSGVARHRPGVHGAVPASLTVGGETAPGKRPNGGSAALPLDLWEGRLSPDEITRVSEARTRDPAVGGPVTADRGRPRTVTQGDALCQSFGLPSPARKKKSNWKARADPFVKNENCIVSRCKVVARLPL